MKLSSMLLNEDYEFNERLAGDKEEELFEEEYDAMSNNYEACPNTEIMDISQIYNVFNNIFSMYYYY